MPFSSLSAGGDAALELPISGGGLGEGAQDASSEWGQMAAAELWSLPERRRGLSTAQLQRIVVAQGYWPRDYAQMSVRLQRQVLADAVRYCIAGGPAVQQQCGEQLRRARRCTSRPTYAGFVRCGFFLVPN